jgi:predicted phosphodiesterase
MSCDPSTRGGRQVPGATRPDDRVLVAGDTHGNLWWIGCLVKIAAANGCVGVVQLGDFGFWPDHRILRNCGWATIDNGWLDEVAALCTAAGVWMRVIDGNHDAHPLGRECYPADMNGVRPIRDGLLDWADRGAVWQWAGRRFGALGGGVSIDRHARTEHETWWATEIISDDDVDTLIANTDAEPLDVLLAHDAPALPPGMRPLNDPVLRADCAASVHQIDRAVTATSPTLVLHGHYHRFYQSIHGTSRVVGLASDIEAPRPGSCVVLDLANLEVSTPAVDRALM